MTPEGSEVDLPVKEVRKITAVIMIVMPAITAKMSLSVFMGVSVSYNKQTFAGCGAVG